MSGRLTGVGVGPGDPELITLKAVRVLGEADAVFVPVARGQRPGYAERVVAGHVDPSRLQRLEFALGDDPGLREDSWDRAGTAVAGIVGGGGHAVFATIGDPNLYSTFTYLAATVRRLIPDVEVATIPGITALQDLAARSGTVLAEGDQTLALLPFTAGPQRFAQALAEHDSVVAYKGGRFLAQVRAALEAAGRRGDAVFGARLGLDGEMLGEIPDGDAPYLSTVLVTRRRGARGGRL